MIARLLAGLVFYGSMASVGVAASGPTVQDRQQAACYDDVMRLCSDDVPDIDRVTACMKNKRQQVGAACAAFYPKGSK